MDQVGSRGLVEETWPAAEQTEHAAKVNIQYMIFKEVVSQNTSQTIGALCHF